MKVKSTKYSRRVNNKKTKKKVNKSKTKPNPVIKKEVRQDGVTEYTVRKIMTDEQIKNKIGRYFPETLSVILREDADVYSQDENGNRELLISFRKNVLTDALCKVGIQCLKKSCNEKTR